ncbi:hypothetical protein A2U01_0019778, partial [Trifolium medium]|nr:hypothetical protein [Trifolium medium]
ASRQVLLEDTVGSDGLYQFKPFKFLTTTGVSTLALVLIQVNFLH